MICVEWGMYIEGNDFQDSQSFEKLVKIIKFTIGDINWASSKVSMIKTSKYKILLIVM